MAQIFVSSVDSCLAKTVQKLIPAVNVVRVDRKSSESLTTADRRNIEMNAEVLLADVPVLSEVVYSAKKLKWAASTWAGVDNLMQGIDPNNPPACVITRMGRAFNKLMAEYVLGYILTKERFIIQLAKEQEHNIWNKEDYSQYRSLSDLTVAILGVGEIGQDVARLCDGVGMTVIGITRTRPSAERRCPAVSDYRTSTELPEVLSQCDYVCNILPSTPETAGLLSGEMFSHCKQKKSVFINIGRGDITDEESLVTAISKGWLGGAVLDVFATEPLHKESRLWNLPGVLITPHVAGVSLTNQVASSFVENYKLYIEDKPLQFRVNYQHGY